MNFIDKVIYVLIAFFYNIFVHFLVSIMYKDTAFNDKNIKSVQMLFLFGVAGIILGRYVIKNYIVKRGLLYGGTALLITAVFANWHNLLEESKLVILGFIFVSLVWFAYVKTQGRR